MPQVPIYDRPQVREAALEGGFQRPTSAGQDLMRFGQSLAQAGDAVDRIMLREDQAASDKSQAEIAQRWLKWDAENRPKYRGENVGQYEAEAAKWWQDTEKTYGQSLNNRAKSLASRGLVSKRASAMGSVTGYVATEKERHADESAVASKGSEVQFAISTGTAAALTAARSRLQEINAAVGARKGWTTDQVAQANVKDLSDMHVAYTLNLARRDPAAAQVYFSQNRAEIVPSAQGQLSERLETQTATADGDAGAEAVWSAAMGGKGYNAAVDLSAMEAQVRAQFKGDTTRTNAALQGLRQRADAFNKSQTEYNAANTNRVFGLLDSGQPLNRVRQSDAWLALPETERRRITNALESEAATRASRAAAEAQRAAAVSSRELNQLQINERLNFMRNGDKYLSVSDPTKLATMTRPQVEAMRADFGMDAVKHLLDRWDTLQKPGKVAEAKMDREDFNVIAQDLGLRPFDPKKNEQERAALGNLQYRVEQMIDATQRQTGKTLTREEKMTLMRTEMARTVTVGGFFSDDKVPVIQLTPEQLRKVVVPAQDRAQIVEALQAKYREDPTNPAYAPTDENVRRLYLSNRSRAAGLINGQ